MRSTPDRLGISPSGSPLVRALVTGALAAVLTLVAPTTVLASAPDDTALVLPGDTLAPDDTTAPDDTAAPGDTAPPSTNEFENLERTDCIGNFNPKPGCGRKPTHSGDRGGPLQWTVFAVMLGGIAFIGWRIVVGARRRPS